MIYFIMYLLGGAATYLATELTLSKNEDKLSTAEFILLMLLWPAFLGAFFIYFIFEKM